MKKSEQTELVIFKGAKGQVKLRGDFHHETLWATQAEISEIFGVERSVVTKHVNNVFKDGELDEKSNVQKMHIAFFLQFTFLKDVTDVLGNNGSVSLK